METEGAKQDVDGANRSRRDDESKVKEKTKDSAEAGSTVSAEALD